MRIWRRTVCARSVAVLSKTLEHRRPLSAQRATAAVTVFSAEVERPPSQQIHPAPVGNPPFSAVCLPGSIEDGSEHLRAGREATIRVVGVGPPQLRRGR